MMIKTIKFGNKALSFLKKLFGSRKILVLLFLAIIILELMSVIIFNSKNGEKLPAPILYAKLIKNNCRESQEKMQCYSIQFLALTKKSSLEYSLNVLASLQTIDSSTYNCHLISHYISRGAVEKNPSGWRDVLKKINLSVCNYGFTHGVLEELSVHDKSFEVNSQSIPRVCEMLNKFKNSKDGVDQGCAHIMGHILLAEYCDLDIAKSIEKSVKVCSELSSPYQHECFAGTFMESFTRDNLAVHCLVNHIKWNDANITKEEEICKSYTGEAALGCWQEISHMYNSKFMNSPELVFQACSRAPTWNETVYCYTHGVNTLVLNPTADKAYFASLCIPLEKDVNAHDRCITNAVSSPLYASIKFSERVISFCSSQEEKYQKKCFDTLTNLIFKKADPNIRTKICDSLPQEYRLQCILKPAK